MRHMVSLSEVRSTRTCIPPATQSGSTGNQASMIDLQDQPQQGAPVG